MKIPTTIQIVIGLAAAFFAFSTAQANEVEEGTYKLEAVENPDIIAGRKTELWAQVYAPKQKEPRPLLVFLHGNHATCGIGEKPRRDNSCQYTNSGVCPEGYIPAPNHLGYSYVAKDLAELGYWVVSINANRGITCGSGVSGDFGLNLARGRLILDHLRQLSEWNANGGAEEHLGFELKGKLDFTQIGLMGHSRGGEGTRAAYYFFNDASSGWKEKIGSDAEIKAIFEIAPVDGQTSKRLDAFGVPWVVLLPACDGDVSDLQGVKPYDRMITKSNTMGMLEPKATYYVWGTNHNFYNTEWQRSDSSGCSHHEKVWGEGYQSTEQQLLAKRAMVNFFLAHVGETVQKEKALFFDPLTALPRELTDLTTIERAASDSQDSKLNLVFEDFNRETGINSSGEANDVETVAVNHGVSPRRHDRIRKGASFKWEEAGENVYWQANWSPEGQGKDISQASVLQFDVTRTAEHVGDISATDFSVTLIDAQGNSSEAVKISKYANLIGPVGGRGMHELMQTIRLPLADFGGIDLERVRSLRLTFDGTKFGDLIIAQIRVLEQVFGKEKSPVLSNRTPVSNNYVAVKAPQHGTLGSFQPISVGLTVGEGNCWIDVKSAALEPRGALPVLNIGPYKSSLTKRPEDGRIDKMSFKIDCRAEGALAANVPSFVSFQGADASDRIELK